MKHVKFFKDFGTNEGMNKVVSGVLIGAALAAGPTLKAQTTTQGDTSPKTQFAMHGAFPKEKELRLAILKRNLTAFYGEEVTVTINDKEKIVDLEKLNSIIDKYLPKNTVFKKSTEANNGYTIAFGSYKGDDALVYFTFNMSQDNKIIDVIIETND